MCQAGAAVSEGDSRREGPGQRRRPFSTGLGVGLASEFPCERPPGSLWPQKAEMMAVIYKTCHLYNQNFLQTDGLLQR